MLNVHSGVITVITLECTFSMAVGSGLKNRESLRRLGGGFCGQRKGFDIGRKRPADLSDAPATASGSEDPEVAGSQTPLCGQGQKACEPGAGVLELADELFHAEEIRLKASLVA